MTAGIAGPQAAALLLACSHIPAVEPVTFPMAPGLQKGWETKTC